MFPGSLQKTVLSLVLGQLTLTGYLLTRKAVFQGIFLLPLPFTTIWVMKFFDEHYGSTLRNQSGLLFSFFWIPLVFFIDFPMLFTCQTFHGFPLSFITGFLSYFPTMARP